MSEELCIVPLDKRWVGPAYRRRETITTTKMCLHTEARHEWGICYDCDINHEFASMHHDFTPGALTELNAPDSARTTLSLNLED